MASSKKRIIYLEDDEFTRQMVKSQFENAGFSVDAFSSFDELMKTLEQDKCDIVVTDLHVHGHDPAQLIKSIKMAHTHSLVVLSGVAVEVPGANLVIEKPLSDQGIKAVIQLLPEEEVKVNLSKVLKFACGDQGLLRRYVSTFIENYEKDLLMLKREVSNGNNKEVESLAHKMLSSVSYYDQGSLIELLQKLELYASEMSKKQILDDIQQIEHHSGKLLSGIRKQVWF
ncbi:response regulator [Fulvivirga sp. 29W222]|uniref:Response regulator n=2 Tax=Fulvivirga marina TaxID=2494733 RepID=A0A937G157_9BACT|nr:response regulator [Fulvivirga marina]